MSRIGRWVFALALAAMLVLAWVLWMQPIGIGLPASRPSPSSAPVTGTAFAGARALPASAPDVENVKAESRAIAATAAASQPGNDLAEIRGRFLLPTGEPAAHVRLQMKGWEAGSDRVMRFGKPKEWKAPNGETGSDGRFSFRFDAPRAYQFTLDADLEHWGKVQWRWSELEPQTVMDLGDVGLTTSGTIVGRLTDSAGKPIGGEWLVYAESSARSTGAGSDATRLRTSVDAETGAFRLEGLPPGSAQLKAYSRIAKWIKGPVVEVQPGQETQANLEYQGPDNNRRIVVTTFVATFHPLNDGLDPIRVLPSAGEPRIAKKIPGSSQSWSVEDLDSGTYTVEIDDPRFLKWSQAGVSPGQSVNALLMGSSAIVLSVADAQSGTPVDGYGLKVRFRNVNFSPNLFQLLKRGDPTPTGGLVKGLVAGDLTLVVKAEGYPACEVDVDALQPRETRNVTVRLSRGEPIRGVVLESDGTTPATGIDVVLQPERDPSLVRVRSVFDFKEGLQTVESRARRTTTDTEGRFNIKDVPPGRYRVGASRNVTITAEQIGVVAPQTNERPLSLTLPSSAMLVGQLRAAPGTRFAGIEVCAHPQSSLEPHEHDWIWPMHYDDIDVAGVSSRVTENGEFRLGPLPLGVVRVCLNVMSNEKPNGLTGSSSMGPIRFDLGQVVLGSSGETRTDFNLGERSLGSLTLEVFLDGRPAAGVTVSAVGELGAVYGNANANGVVTFAPILSGPWKVRATALDSSWQAEWETPVTVPAAGEAHERLELQLSKGTLTVRDAETGEPMRAHTIVFELPSRKSCTGRSDEKGRVTISLVPAEYVVKDGGDGNGAVFPNDLGVKIQWTVNGPSPAEVRIARGRIIPGTSGR